MSVVELRGQRKARYRGRARGGVGNAALTEMAVTVEDPMVHANNQQRETKYRRNLSRWSDSDVRPLEESKRHPEAVLTKSGIGWAGVSLRWCRGVRI